LVSVIIAVYNGGNFIAQTLESLKAQTFENWECLIVDDGSSDDTSTIVEDFAKVDPRFHLIKTEGGNGPYVAANLAFPHCNGEFIARIDADDINLPHRLEIQYDYLVNNPNIQVCGARHWVFGDSTNKKEIVYNTDRQFLCWELIFRNRIVHSTLMFQKKWIESKGGYPPFKLAQDYYIWCSASLEKALSVIDQPLIEWRRHPGTITQNQWESQYENSLDISLSYVNDLLGFAPDRDIFERLYSNAWGFKINSDANLVSSFKLLNKINRSYFEIYHPKPKYIF